ncbi:MAG: MBL fold metallo-hydrolase [Christensenellales bacterium]
MRVCNLGSGSKGNVTYIETTKAKILVDCGLSANQIEMRLHLIGVEPSEIDAIFITHEHSDHIQGLKQFVKKYATDVFLHYLNLEAVLEKQDIDYNKVNCFDVADFIFKDLIVSPFELSHDSAYCVGYKFSYLGQQVSIATDTGYLPSEALNKMMGSDIVYIESNHNELLLLENQNYSVYLKKRILSRKGHLSNLDCAEVIYKLMQGGTRQFVLSHLSDKNNTPDVAFNDVTTRLSNLGVIEGKDVFIDIAYQDRVGTVFEIKSDNNENISSNFNIG